MRDGTNFSVIIFSGRILILSDFSLYEVLKDLRIDGIIFKQVLSMSPSIPDLVPLCVRSVDVFDVDFFLRCLQSRVNRLTGMLGGLVL